MVMMAIITMLMMLLLMMMMTMVMMMVMMGEFCDDYGNGDDLVMRMVICMLM